MRCHFGREEALGTTLPEARILWAEFDGVDGHRETVHALYDIVTGLFGVKDGAGKAPSRPASPAKKPGSPAPGSPQESGGSVLIPELQSALQALIDRQSEKPSLSVLEGGTEKV